MNVHARFTLTEDARTTYYHGHSSEEAVKIKLAAVKGEPFGPATPQGAIDMLLVNPEAVKAFRGVPLGQEFDVIFSPVSKEE